MSPDGLLFLSIFGFLAGAAIPIKIAHDARQLHATDLALLALPTLVFEALLFGFNQKAASGLAPYVYALPVAYGSVALLNVRVFMLPRLGLRSEPASRWTLVASLVAAAAVAVLSHPIYK